MQFDIRIGSIYAILKKTEDKNFEFDCKKRSHDGFIYVLKGKGYFENSNCKKVLNEGSMMILPKDSNYYVKSLNENFQYITTAFKVLPSDWMSILNIPDVVDLGKKSMVGTLTKQLLDTWDERPSFYTMKSRITIEQILINLAEENNETALSFQNEPRLSPALDYIAQHYDTPISANELASLCNLSVSHFRRIFKEKFGMSPMQYRETIRIYWAKQFLKSDLFTVSEVASKLGYYDIYHFSKEFKKFTQKSPLEYKKDKL